MKMNYNSPEFILTSTLYNFISFQMLIIYL